tara:strand:+ start:415 stop:762 length:348 start_codon:yes stop_codon:yes gene_type:complete
MSVIIQEAVTVAKVINTLKDLNSRSIWYAYVSNITAFNVQYTENQEIDFKGFESVKEDEVLTRDEAIEELGSLLYNAYSNAGNYFCPKEGLDELELAYKMLKSGADSQLADYNCD